jgi:hypothetical protein
VKLHDPIQYAWAKFYNIQVVKTMVPIKAYHAKCIVQIRQLTPHTFLTDQELVRPGMILVEEPKHITF